MLSFKHELTRIGARNTHFEHELTRIDTNYLHIGSRSAHIKHELARIIHELGMNWA